MNDTQSRYIERAKWSELLVVDPFSSVLGRPAWHSRVCLVFADSKWTEKEKKRRTTSRSRKDGVVLCASQLRFRSQCVCEWSEEAAVINIDFDFRDVTPWLWDNRFVRFALANNDRNRLYIVVIYRVYILSRYDWRSTSACNDSTRLFESGYTVRSFLSRERHVPRARKQWRVNISKHRRIIDALCVFFRTRVTRDLSSSSPILSAIYSGLRGRVAPRQPPYVRSGKDKSPGRCSRDESADAVSSVTWNKWVYLYIAWSYYIYKVSHCAKSFQLRIHFFTFGFFFGIFMSD